MKRAKVLGSSISIGSYQEFIEEIFYLVANEIPSYVCFANVHMVIEAYKDRTFQNVVNNANVVAPDGRPISLFLKYLQGERQERVCGMDILPDLLKQAEIENKSVYFLGTTDELLSTIKLKASTDFPRLRISGTYSPPFRALSKEEEDLMTLKINEAKPDLVFVSLGCPRQEKWMASHRDRINACLLGVGQAFKVYAGVEKRLPKWMRNLSIEWAYRLFLEPKRLWKRYLFTNTLFLYLTVKHLLSRSFRILVYPMALRKIQEGKVRELNE